MGISTYVCILNEIKEMINYIVCEYQITMNLWIIYFNFLRLKSSIFQLVWEVASAFEIEMYILEINWE